MLLTKVVSEKHLRLYNVSIYRIFYQNRFLNECVRKNFLKFSERWSFFVRYRRTNFLNNNDLAQILWIGCNQNILLKHLED